MAMKLDAVLKPRAACLAFCSKPFMASAKALGRLSIIPRTTASAIVLASFWNGSSRQCLARLRQALKSPRVSRSEGPARKK